MVSFLLIISFLLHIVSLFAIFKLLQKNQGNGQEQNDPREWMELFDTYLKEIKEENARLERKISGRSKEEITVNPSFSSSSAKTEPDQTGGYSPPPIEEKDEVEASLQSRILQLHHKGYSETDIARFLNCGKTEAALVIKLHA
ncbi:DUF6115 domain-containing protein [Lentibacillus sediminis]|uniref:DUF6115 domain-containing protein n=1 Tax=Lentibacillus sediminis TaxID=1940529 RepID=UPI000C1BA8E8|nr:hypothetical protein [Lentibacillus sediminis]